MDHLDQSPGDGPLSPDFNQPDTSMSNGNYSQSTTPIKSEFDLVRKAHRLGRACDPCSIRKTKVRTDQRKAFRIWREKFTRPKQQLTTYQV